MKKRAIIIIGLIILSIALGITYAFFSWQSSNRTNVTITTGEITVTYNAGNNISGITLIPVSTKEVGVTNGTAVYKEITASSTENTYMDLNMTLDTFPSQLAHQSLVWEVYNGNTLINSGNLGSASEDDVINLFSSQPITSTTSTFKLYIWIDGTQPNSNDMMNQNFVFILNATATDEAPPPEPNSPDLVQGLIPVKYDTTNGWVKADNTNTNNDWYDYDNKMWANAVLVSSTNRTTYMNANAGTAIPESDVLAYYVWIPRYKYKVFNINKVINTDSYNAQSTGIDIVFENETQSTGTVSCNYNFAITDGSLSEICTGNNGDYYTHPAFTFGNQQVRGIWVGKFEISSETPTATNGGGESTTLTVRVKPNVRSWKYNTVTNFYKVIYDMQIENNIYGLNTSRTNTDSHMLKNIEWGAVAYLTNSKYGRCTNNTCTEVTINNSSDYITGNAGNSVSASHVSGIANAYDTASGQLASTTGNIYGIYDMAGDSAEFVMGNMSKAAGSYTYYAYLGGSNYIYTGNEKYIDTYANGSSYNNQTAYNRSRLGDATGETKSWYSDSATFVYSSFSWFIRGGYCSSTTDAGPFSFNIKYGDTTAYSSARLALLSTSN